MYDRARPLLSGQKRTGNDRGLLFFLVALILFSPYLPQFGPIVGQVRFDNLLVPVLTGWVAARDLLRGRVRIIPPLVVYVVFLVWMWAVSIMVVLEPDPKYAEIGSSAVDLVTDVLTGVESYLRPLMFLYIASKIDVGRDDFVDLIRFLLIVSIPLVLVAFLQVFPPTSTITNDLVYLVYTNQRIGAAQGLQAVLSGGRAMSVFGQVGTFGQYCLTMLAILLVRAYGVRLVRSRPRFVALVVMYVIGGLASGSKVFTGGILMLTPMVLFLTPLRPHVLRPRFRYVARGFAILLGLLTLFVAMTTVISRYATGRLLNYFDLGSLIQTYMAGRFIGGEAGELPKVIRSGAVSIALDYPVTGLGLTKMGATVDSFWIGLVVLSGFVGVLLFLGFLVLLLRRMHILSVNHPDPLFRGMGRMLLFLGIVFIAAGIGFHTFIQDRAGDLYWILVGLLWSRGVVGIRPYHSSA